METTNNGNDIAMQSNEIAPPNCDDADSLPNVDNLTLDDKTSTDIATIHSPNSFTISLPEFIIKVEEFINQNKDSNEVYQYICQNSVFNEEELLEAVQLLFENDDYKKLIGAVNIRKCLSLIENPLIEELINSNCAPYLIEMLKQNHNAHLKFEACWSITNIASLKPSHVEYLINLDVIPVLVECLHFDHLNVVEQAIWAIGNIAGDDESYIDLVNETGVLAILSHILSESEINSSLRRNCSWCICSLFRGESLPDNEYVHMTIPVLIKVLKQEDTYSICFETLWTLSYITEKDKSAIQVIFDCDGVKTIVKGLKCSIHHQLVPTIKIIGNITLTGESQTEYLINCGVVGDFKNILSSQQQYNVIQECCWAISCICATNKRVVYNIMQQGLDVLVMQNLCHESNKVKAQAIWCLRNMTTDLTHEMVEHLIQNYLILAVIQFIKSNNYVTFITAALECLGQILEFNKELKGDNENKIIKIVEQSGGLDVLEQLQVHKNEHIRSKVVELIQKYFNTGEQN